MDDVIPIAQVREAYDAGAEVLRQAGCDVEPWDVTKAVEDHRWSWQPAVTRVALIAESHVFTSAQDVAIHVRQVIVPDQLSGSSHVRTPSAFVRLVYCLGYGEPALLSAQPNVPNSGTPQYWKIFGDLAGTSPTPPAETRLAWKLRTLRTLSRRGIWLLDASVHGIYRPGRQKVPPATKRQLHLTWWHTYGKHVIASLRASYPDLYVCVIGKMVADTLDAEGIPFDTWIYQPNAMVSNAVRLSRYQVLLKAVATRCPLS